MHSVERALGADTRQETIFKKKHLSKKVLRAPPKEPHSGNIIPENPEKFSEKTTAKID